MYRIKCFLKVYEIRVQNCIPFIGLLQYIPESKNLIDGTSALSKPCLLLPQDVVNSSFNSTYQHSAKDLMTGKSVIPLQFVHSHKLPFFGNFTISPVLQLFGATPSSFTLLNNFVNSFALSSKSVFRSSTTMLS